MKYFYMICLALSSLFIYKQLQADEQSQKYAFFMPGNAFQNNMEVHSIENMHPRRVKQIVKQQQDIYQDDSDNDEDNYTENKEPEIKRPYVHKKIEIFEPVQETDIFPAQPSKEDKENTAKQEDILQTISEITTAEIKEETDKQNRNTEELAQTETNQTVLENETEEDEELTSIEKYQQKDIEDLLDEYPLPDPDLPKFKQRYAMYGMDLRILYRRNKMPYNPDLEKTLAKANNIRRFVVK